MQDNQLRRQHLDDVSSRERCRGVFFRGVGGHVDFTQCQTKAEMSAFVQSRDVRLQGVMAERNSALP